MRRVLSGILLFLTLLLAPAVNAFAEDLIFSKLYPEAVIAQNSNEYAKLLSTWAKDNELEGKVVAALDAELQQILKLKEEEREKAFQEILYYYSIRHKKYKRSATGIADDTGYNWVDLTSRAPDPHVLAQRLSKSVRTYEKTVTIPILEQVEQELVRDFPDSNILCLGRDFTAGYVLLRLRRKLPRQHLFTLNISRAIRDHILSGQTREIVKTLKGIGLSKKRLLERGLVFLDSSMAGKIPRAVLSALIEDFTPEEIHRFLKKVDIRYIQSRPVDGPTFQDAVDKAAKKFNEGNSNAWRELLEVNYPIDMFKLTLPEPVKEYNPNHLHNLLEHRPKFVTQAEHFVVYEGQTMLSSPAPRDSVGKVKALLGLSADLELARLVLGLEKEPTESSRLKLPALDDFESSPEIKAFFNELRRVPANSDRFNRFKHYKNWQNSQLPGAPEALAALEIVERDDEEFPLALVKNGRIFYLLRKKVGEGRNVEVFLTERGTVLKVLKDPKNAKKQILQAWFSTFLEDYGIRVAKTLWIDPTGVLLEQEYVPGESLEYTYGFAGQGLPDDIRKQVVSFWNKAKGLTKIDFWLDLKAANCHLTEDRKVVFVDYAPRLNKGHRTYFMKPKTEADAERPLTEEEFLDMFLYRQIRDGNTFKQPEGLCKDGLTS